MCGNLKQHLNWFMINAPLQRISLRVHMVGSNPTYSRMHYIITALLFANICQASLSVGALPIDLLLIFILKNLDHKETTSAS